MYKHIVEQQLAIDYDCTLEEVQSKENIFRLKKRNKGARLVGDDDCLLKIAVINEKLLVMAGIEILRWCEGKLNLENGAWLSEPESLILIHEKLKDYGQALTDTHHYYIPSNKQEKVEERFDVEWYKEEEILRFKDDNRFDEALLFDEEIPDMLAVCAVENGKILGLAGATKDCENLWQIGVNVTQEGRGKGVGSYVVTLLKERVLEEGKVPFYSTVESHIKSQKVAIRSGFEPIFYEIFSE